MTKFLNAPFIGLKNYYEILFDEKSLIRRGFWFALRNTAIYTVVVTLQHLPWELYWLCL